MKAVLKDIFFVYETFNFESYSPDDDENFSIDLLLQIGAEDSGKSADNFDLCVCTPGWINKNSWVPKLMRHTLIIRRYDKEIIKKVINDYIDKCEGNDWMELASKLSRVFFWEYEDCNTIDGK